jgi:hypothetical protein
MMPLEQTTINRTTSAGNTKNGTEDESEIITKYTWEQVNERRRCNQTPDTTIEKKPFSLIPKTDMKRSQDSQTRTCKKTRQIKQQTLKINNRGNLNPHQYIYGITIYREMVKHLATTIEEEQYYCKTVSNETIKFNVTTSEF